MNKHECIFQVDVFSESNLSPWRKEWMKLICMYDGNPRARDYIRSSVTLDFEKRRQIASEWWYIIHPFSLFRLYWETFMICIYFAAQLSVPFFMTWRENLFFPYSSDILKILCTIDVIMTCFTGYVDEVFGEVVIHQGKIMERFLKTQFWYVLIGSFPWTSLFVQYVVTEEDLVSYPAYHLLGWTGLFAVAHHTIVLLAYSRNIRDYFQLGMRTYRIYRLCVYFVLVLHWMTCIECNLMFAFVGDMNTKSIKARVYDNITRAETYMICCFRACLLALKVNRGDQLSEMSNDIYPDIICLLAGFVIFYFLLEELLLLDPSRTSPKTRYRTHKGRLNEYMRKKEMPQAMQERFRSFYEYRFQKMYFQESTILSTLSTRLHQEINMHACRQLVEESLLFRNVPRSVMVNVIKVLKQDIFLPHEVLIKAGSPGDCMFFLTSGTVAVMTRAGNEIAHLRDGSFFGEMAMIMEDERRVTSIIAIEFCEVYRLDRADFQRVIRPVKELFQEVQRVAMERLQQTLFMESAFRHLAQNILRRGHATM